MLTKYLKNLVWVALPLGLAVGCAENRPATEAAYAPAPNVVLTPTSAEPEQRIYRETTTTTTTSTSPDVTVNAAPRGASASTWAVAEEIRQKLLSDTTLAPLGSSLIANVGNDGVVTLTGNVGSSSEQDRVCKTISELPGVKRVDSQLTVGFHGSSPETVRMH